MKTVCETVKIDLEGLSSYAAAMLIFPFPSLFFCTEAPCLGLHLNLHGDPNTNEQKMVLFT